MKVTIHTLAPLMAAAALLATPLLRAQTAPAAPADSVAPAVQLEKFSVTGSFIKRLDEEKALPLTTLRRDDIEVIGVSTAVELFSTIPQVGRVPVSESGNGGAGIRGDIATVNMRSLGSGNTLVLLNGRRLAPHPITGPEAGAPFLSVNINVLPTAAVDRIEVLRDGASAIYGTDASAGVINTILRRNVKGVEIKARYADTEDGGAREVRGTISTGATFNGGAGSIVAVYDYFDRTALENTDREWAASADQRLRAPAPWNGTTTDNSADFRSAHGYYGRFQRGVLNADGSFTGSRPATGIGTASIATNGTFYFIPPTLGSDARTWTGTQPDQSVTSAAYAHFLDINKSEYILPASRRHNLYLSADNRFSDRVTAFGDLTYYRSDSTNQREGTRIDNFVDNNILVSKDNPYNPFGSRFYSTTGAPNADGSARLTGAPSDVLVGRLTLQDYPPRVINVHSEALRGVAGARGTIGEEWQWESAVLYSQAETQDHEDNSVKENQFRDAVARTDNTAYNPFGTTFTIVGGIVTPTGGRFTNPQAVLDSFTGTFVHEGKTTLTSWDFRVNGELWELPAGALAMATGGEVRHETLFDFRDLESGRMDSAYITSAGYRPQLNGDNNYLQQSPTDNTDASRDVQALFVEFNVPLLGGKKPLPGVKSLDLLLAARYENYSDFGDTTKPKIGVSWRPNSWTMVRGSYNEGFRAPNLASLFSGNVSRAFQSAPDNYRFPVTNLIDDGASGRRRGIRAGNRNLTPEEAETTTVGVVVDLPFAKGLTVSVDWWKIDQTDSIALISGTTSLTDDAVRLLAENAKQIAAGKPPTQIDLSAAGNPYVVRNAVTQADRDAFALYNSTRAPADQRAPVGTLQVINEPYINASGRNLSGVDFALTYRLPKNSLGQFVFAADAAYLTRFDFQQDAATATVDQRWLDGRSKWKGNGSVRWRQGLWGAGLYANYIGSYRDSGLRSSTVTASYISADGYYIVDDYLTYNLNVTRDFKSDGWMKDVSVRVGVNNLLNEDPPFLGDNFGTSTGNYDVRGRLYYVELTKKF
jgi:iron complex outermembrane receptor protein